MPKRREPINSYTFYKEEKPPLKKRCCKTSCLCIKYWVPYIIRCIGSIVVLVVIGIYCQQETPWRWSRTNTALMTFNWKYNPHTLIPLFDSPSNYSIFLDSHSHTQYSDGSLTPEQNIQWHIANGFNAIFITDHNEIQGAIEGQRIAREKYNGSIVVLTGIEWSNCRGHYNFLVDVNQLSWDSAQEGWSGPNNTFVPVLPVPTDKQFRTVFDTIHKLGGLVVANHIPWSKHYKLDIPSLSDLLEFGIDFIEVGNTNTFDYQSLVFAQRHGLGIIGGTDMHVPQQRTYSWTTLNANLTYTSIMNALKTRKTNILWDAIGTPSWNGNTDNMASGGYIFLLPLIWLGEFAQSFYVYHRGPYSFVHKMCPGYKKYVTFQSKQFVFGIVWLMLAFIFYNMLWYAWKRIAPKCKEKCKKDDTIWSN